MIHHIIFTLTLILIKSTKRFRKLLQLAFTSRDTFKGRMKVLHIAF